MDWGAQLQELFHGFLLFLPRLITALAIFVVTLVVGGLAKRAIKRTLASRVRDVEILELLGRLARWGVIVLGTLTALDQVNFDVTALLPGWVSLVLRSALRCRTSPATLWPGYFS